MRKFYTAEAVTEEHLDKVCDQIADTILDSLPKEHHQVFVLRYWYFMPVEEISKCCNMNKSKVETILFRTGNKLKE